MKTRWMGAMAALMLCACMLTGCAWVLPDEQAGASYDSIQDLSGKVVGVQLGTLYEDSLLKLCPEARVQIFSSAADLIVALEQGRIDAFLAESMTYSVQKLYHEWVKALPETVAVTSITFAVGRGEKQAQLERELNAFIAQYRENGMKEEMDAYWIEGYSPDICEVNRDGITGENGVISVAVESGYEPFSYIGKGMLQGYDVDFIYRFCREYGYEPRFYEVEYDAIPSGLSSGRFDIGANIIYEEERLNAVTLTDAYNEIEILAVVKDGGGENGTLLSDIAGSVYSTFIKDQRWKLFLEGILVTLCITVGAVVLGTLLGFALYLIWCGGGRVLRCILEAMVALIVGTPPVLLLMILFYLVFASPNISGMLVSILGFMLMFACAVYGLLHEGVQAVGKRQREAAQALGYSAWQAFFVIILPQAVEHVFPDYRDEISNLIKESSIVGYIAVRDLTRISDLVRNRTYEAFFPLIVTAIIYYILTWLLMQGVDGIGRLLHARERHVDRAIRGISLRRTDGR